MGALWGIKERKEGNVSGTKFTGKEKSGGSMEVRGFRDWGLIQKKK